MAGKPMKQPVQLFGVTLWPCGKCGEPKQETSYHKDLNRANGLRPTCKDCCKVQALTRYSIYWRLIQGQQNPKAA